VSKVDEIDKERLPRHVAVIMDGNGRWAKKKGLMRVVGHERGSKSVNNIVEASAKLRLNAIGCLDDLPKTVKKELLEVMENTKDNSHMVLTLALSYGSRDEIIGAVKEISNKVKNNIISVDAIDESIINKHLYTQILPDVDLLIRTSGEHRISNFLLWQIAYAELYFTRTLWPDFKKNDYYEALINYQKRERRFGKTSEQLS